MTDSTTKPLTLSDLLTEAHRVVEIIEIDEARKLIEEENALLLDIRDAPELEKTGMAKGAHHISRGMLEFRADPTSPYHDKQMDPNRPVILYCASGGRAALAGKVLIEMGYSRVYNLGGFKDWAENGGEVVHAVDPGMG